jgi:NAD(P)-dependent dehydrogenase (short-subunit alcohol dehydrogenase family)
MQRTNKVVLVTGASRGLGRGIARQFGRAGATVYLTSRSSSEDTLAQAAKEVVAGGGQAISMPVDHCDARQVKALVERIREESGKLDILVNNAAAVNPALATPGPFWEKPLELGDMIEVPLHASYIMSYFAAPLMIQQRRGLIVNISFYGAATYFHGPAYGATKAGTDKMSFDMAVDLRPHGVAAVSFWPGFIYSDAVAQWVDSTPPDQIPAGLARQLPDFERPEFTGLVLNALYEDPELLSYSGQTLIGAELGKRYGIKDLDGKQPRVYRETMGNPLTFVLPPH